jgi:putative transferase (TIGR04331 family)
VRDRLLVTTALEETWGTDVPVLFLGEWCRLHARRTRWATMDGEVMPYPWDDRDKLFEDYRYLVELHERLLSDLTPQLNGLHGVDHGTRYWRTLIGPWLGYFVQMLFDRWSSVQAASAREDLSHSIVLTGLDELVVPADMADFERMFVGDEWNHYVYAAILRRSTAVPLRAQPWGGDAASNSSVPRFSLRVRGRRLLGRVLARTAGALGRDEDAFLLATYLPPLDEMRLRMRLRQLPLPCRSAVYPRMPRDASRREWVVKGDERTDFESFVRFMIPQQMPTAYLEGYQRLVAQADEMPWPRRPRVIWTSVSFSSDEVFKVWAAQKVEEGAPLVIGQHGGHYGVGKWSFVEEHEIAISDRFLSWGWSAPEEPRVKPVGQLKAKRPLGVQHASQPGALLVTVVVPRYSYFMYSIAVSRQWLDYFEEQCAFVAELPPDIRDALTVRMYPHDYGWGQVARWRERFPELRLDEGQGSIDELIRGSRLYISTYNATTFLESMTMNVPTVIYWKPEHWELRASAMPYFDDLERVGVFHPTPESAARHVAAIWDDVGAWWNQPELRAVVEAFTSRYSALSDDLLDRIEDALDDAMRACGQVEGGSVTR